MKVHKCCTSVNKAMPEISDCCHYFLSNSCKTIIIYLYFSDCAKEFESIKARDEDLAKRLWDESARLVGIQHWDPFTAPDTNYVQPRAV